MPAVSTIIAGAGLALAASTAGYQINSAEEQKKKARRAMADQKANAEKLFAEEQKQSNAQQSLIDGELNTANRDSARNRQRALTAGAQGRGSTILTGGAGLSAPATGATTILGA